MGLSGLSEGVPRCREVFEGVGRCLTLLRPKKCGVGTLFR